MCIVYTCPKVYAVLIIMLCMQHYQRIPVESVRETGYQLYWRHYRREREKKKLLCVLVWHAYEYNRAGGRKFVNCSKKVCFLSSLKLNFIFFLPVGLSVSPEAHLLLSWVCLRLHHFTTALQYAHAGLLHYPSVSQLVIITHGL